MILTAEECISVMKDRDYATLLLLVLFCLSLLGIYANIFTQRDAGLLLLAAFLSRFFFIYRTERLFDMLSKELTTRMDQERARPDFTTGNLSLILKKEFAGISKSVKTKCLNKLVEEMEIDLGPEGNYTFYPTKVYNQPGKDRRRKKI
jgi:hypothetical protein